MAIEKSVSLTIDRLGLSYKEIFTLSVLKILEEKQTEYGVNIFRQIQNDLMGKRVSRSHFYTTLEKMANQGLITEVPSTDKRKKIYAATQEGIDKRTWYRESYLEQLSAVQQIVHIILHDLTETGTPREVMVLGHDHQKFFSKVIYVRRLVEYIFLKHLHSYREVIPSKLLDQCLAVYGWQPAKTYFYEVLWDMEKKLWVSGAWESERRSNRIYRLESKGEEVFPEIEEELLHSTRTVRVFINSVITVLS